MSDFSDSLIEITRQISSN